MIVRVTKVEYYEVPDGTDPDRIEYTPHGFYDLDAADFIPFKSKGSVQSIIEDDNEDEPSDHHE